MIPIPNSRETIYKNPIYFILCWGQNIVHLYNVRYMNTYTITKLQQLYTMLWPNYSTLVQCTLSADFLVARMAHPSGPSPRKAPPSVIFDFSVVFSSPVTRPLLEQSDGPSEPRPSEARAGYPSL